MGSRSLTLPRSRLQAHPLDAARALLGCLLVASPDGNPAVTVLVTEVEAYGGSDDPASHAWRGRTDRNAVMFGPAGFAYVYFSYGMHWCLNVSAGPPGEAAAVLLRAGRVVSGADVAARRRPGVRSRDQARGPARLTRTLAVTGAYDGMDLCDPASALRLTPGGSAGTVCSGPRTGVTREPDRPWRLWLDGEATVSDYRRSPRADAARLLDRDRSPGGR